jgi:hypothetical protein
MNSSQQIGSGYGKRLWLPSQNGLRPECLQAHHATVVGSSKTTLMGAKPLPLCAPSQNGCVAECPHVHHQYSPGSTFWTMGDFWQTMGSLIKFGLLRSFEPAKIIRRLREQLKTQLTTALFHYTLDVWTRFSQKDECC